MLVATHTTKPLIASKEWHQMSFYLVGGCMLVALLGLGSMSIFGPDIHRWHDAELFAQAIILLGGSLLSLFWQPQVDLARKNGEEKLGDYLIGS